MCIFIYLCECIHSQRKLGNLTECLYGVYFRDIVDIVDLWLPFDVVDYVDDVGSK